MKKLVSYTLDEELIKKVEEDSKKQDRSRSQIVNRILKKHYEKERK